MTRLGIVAPGDPEFSRIMKNPGAFNRKAHEKSDVDNGPKAIHHTLGFGSGMAASGSYVRSQLVGDWVLFGTLTAPWVLGSLGSEPMYRIVNGMIELRGKIDYASTIAAGTLATIITLPVTRTYSGSCAVINASNETASQAAGAVQLGNLRLASSGVLALITHIGLTGQRWVHFDGARFDIIVPPSVA